MTEAETGAAAGFSVKMYERYPVIAALLGDTLRRTQTAALPALTSASDRTFEAR